MELSEFVSGNRKNTVLNRLFFKWEERVNGVFRPQSLDTVYRIIRKREQIMFEDDIQFYRSGQGLELLRECREHAQERVKGLGKKEVIVLVHPLCAHMDSVEMTDYMRKDLVRYEEGLRVLLNSPEVRERFDFVLVEMPESYAARTSGWVEEGDIGDVVFTGLHSGELLEPTQILNERDMYFLGGYLERCLSATKDELDPSGNAKFVRDLSLRSPQDVEGLVDSFLLYFPPFNFPEENSVHSSELY